MAVLAPTAESLALIADSQARRELAKRLIAGEAIVWVVVERGENDGGAGVKPLDSWIDEYVRDLVAMDEAKKEEAPEAATQAAWSRTVFPYALPSRFQLTLNQDIPSRLEMPSSEA